MALWWCPGGAIDNAEKKGMPGRTTQLATSEDLVSNEALAEEGDGVGAVFTNLKSDHHVGEASSLAINIPIALRLIELHEIFSATPNTDGVICRAIVIT